MYQMHDMHERISIHYRFFYVSSAYVAIDLKT